MENKTNMNNQQEKSENTIPAKDAYIVFVSCRYISHAQYGEKYRDILEFQEI